VRADYPDVERAAATRMSDLADDAALRARFEALAREHEPALRRFVRGYESDIDRQRDLTQDILIAIWRALPSFEGRSSPRTWAYRIAHNVAVTHVVKGARDRLTKAVPIEDVDALFAGDAAKDLEQHDAVARVAALVRALKPTDAQVILLYLEGLDHAEIADVTGHTATNVAVKVHRIKDALRRLLTKGGGDGQR
jgi:RNA polymerase sigma-70 factor (ECF subfamily)